MTRRHTQVQPLAGRLYLPKIQTRLIRVHRRCCNPPNKRICLLPQLSNNSVPRSNKVTAHQPHSLRSNKFTARQPHSLHTTALISPSMVRLNRRTLPNSNTQLHRSQPIRVTEMQWIARTGGLGECA